MSDLASIRVGVQTLRVNPMRTILSTLGVVIGVASLVAVLSLGDGMESFARKEIERTTSVQNVFVSVVRVDTVDGVPLVRERFHLFDPEDAASARAVPGIAGVAIAAHGTTWLAADGWPRRRAARVTATTAGADVFHALELASGRFFSEAEAAASAPVVVVSMPVARALSAADPAAAVGRELELRGGRRRVVGVLADRGARDGMAAFVPLAAAGAVLAPGEAGQARTLMVKAPRVEDVAAVRAAVESWASRRFGASWRRDFQVATDEARSAQMQRAILMFKLFLGSMTAISLLVGGIGIMNVLLASVTERTREIGIRKSVGARRRHILLQFLSESVTITGAGSLIGMALGLAGAAAATAFMRAQAEASVYPGFSLSTLLAAALSALVVGIAFGTYPALRAARLSPIEAIRHE